ncbi:hypothetical protein [Selenomonas ruminantium]|uniref:Cell division GTPase FtsZ n=1 Tax=Selenomonas ruminantium TaxID=971 RepID=A0A1I0Y1Z8_SELRU|nr:hypothetical protein [Selenomonas ruminantium]SFB07325.1 Cell division GTPase FtsZ [Selenomonas ruminantium]
MLNFVHIGIGQCGNRIAEQFGKNGKLAFAINTARIDMSGIDNKAIAPKNQIHIALAGNKDGAGRNPDIGRESMEANLDKVYESIMRATKDESVDRYVLWAGLGGGTGTGGIAPLMQHLIANGHQVMLGMTIPRKKESWIVRMNAIKALTNILTIVDADRQNIVPYVVIDNEQFDGGLASANETIVKDFVRFTKTTTNIPADSAFDDTDFARLLSYKGLVSVVRSTVATDTLKGTDAFAKTIRESWKHSVFAKFSPEDALGVANLVIVPQKFYRQKGVYELVNDNIAYVEEISPPANAYSCIYENKNENIDNIIVYTLLTGMPSPEENIDEMYDAVSEQINETKERRRELKRNERDKQAMRRALDFDPNNIDFDFTAENDNFPF